MNASTFEVCTIHEHPEYMEECCDLLNCEWPRSKNIRRRKLESSYNHLPVSLILIYKGAKNILIGHSRITQVPNDTTTCFVESVLIHPNYRRKGFGKLLMEETEKFASRRGIVNVYLTTHDQQDFYGHLGYTFGSPICTWGGSTLLAKKVSPSQLIGSNDYPPTVTQSDVIHVKKEIGELCKKAPIPPPLPSISKNDIIRLGNCKKCFMKKNISIDKRTN